MNQAESNTKKLTKARVEGTGLAPFWGESGSNDGRPSPFAALLEKTIRNSQLNATPRFASRRQESHDSWIRV